MNRLILSLIEYTKLMCHSWSEDYLAIPVPKKIFLKQGGIWNEFFDPNVAKVEGASNPRHKGWSCSILPQTLYNEGVAAPSACPPLEGFPIGQITWLFSLFLWCHLEPIPSKQRKSLEMLIIIVFQLILPCYLCSYRVDFVESKIPLFDFAWTPCPSFNGLRRASF